MANIASTRFRIIQAVLVLSLGFLTWWVVFAVTAMPFCWNSKDACIPVFQGLLAIPVAIWAATRYARWFRRVWETRGEPDANSPHPAARTLLWVILGAWLGLIAVWLYLVVLAGVATVLGRQVDEENVSDLALALFFGAGAVVGAIAMPRAMRRQTKARG